MFPGPPVEPPNPDGQSEQPSTQYGSVDAGPPVLPPTEVVSALATSIAAHESEQSGSMSANSETALISETVTKLATMAAQSQQNGDGNGGPPPEEIMKMATDVASSLSAGGQTPAELEHFRQHTDAFIKQLQAEGKLPEGLPPEVLQAIPIIQAQNETIGRISLFGKSSRETSEDLRSKRMINGLLHGFLFLILIILGAVESSNPGGMCAIVAGLLMLVALVATSIALEEPLLLMEGMGELEKLKVIQVSEEDVRDIMDNGIHSRKIALIRDTLDVQSTRDMMDVFRRAKIAIVNDGPGMVKKMTIGNAIVWFISSILCIAGSAGAGLTTVGQILILVFGILILVGALTLIAVSVIAIKTVRNAYEAALQSGLMKQLEEYDGKVDELVEKVLKPILEGDFDFDTIPSEAPLPPTKMTDQLLPSGAV